MIFFVFEFRATDVNRAFETNKQTKNRICAVGLGRERQVRRAGRSSSQRRSNSNPTLRSTLDHSQHQPQQTVAALRLPPHRQQQRVALRLQPSMMLVVLAQRMPPKLHCRLIQSGSALAIGLAATAQNQPSLETLGRVEIATLPAPD